MNIIGIDLGGTQIKAVVTDPQGKVLLQETRPTNDAGDDHWKQEVQELIQKLAGKTGSSDFITGISAPGLPDKMNTVILSMPGRLQGLENLNWTNWLKKPAYVLNDAVAALLAEAHFGVAQGKENVVLLTLGTGIGGAILIEGKPYQGSFGKAGHAGHMVVDYKGPKDVTGMPGSLEACVGNYSLEKRSQGRFKSTRILVEAVKTGDEFAKQVWLASVNHLALGIASISNFLSPQLVILGGGITLAGDELFIPLRALVEQYEWKPYGKAVEIAQAGYGEMAGAIGAACFARQRHEIEKTI